MKTLDDFTDVLREKLSENQPEKVLSALLAILKILEGEYYNEAASLSARLKMLRQQEIKGLSSTGMRERIQLINDIYRFLDALEEDENMVSYYSANASRLFSILSAKLPEERWKQPPELPTSTTQDTINGGTPFPFQLWLYSSDQRSPMNVLTFTRELIFGRSNNCDVTLNDRCVSRQHARIFYDQDLLWIEDLGSSNGTYVNGKKVVRDVIKNGTIISIYDIRFKAEILNYDDE